MQKTTKDYGFVSIQLILFILFAVTPSITQIILPNWSSILGLIVTALGLIIVLFAILQLSDALSPFPSPKQGKQLRTNGLYRFSRHPIYSGILLFCIGWTIYSGSFSRLLLTLALYALFYFKSNYEEQKLIEVYGGSYLEYRETTARFFF
ncbi:MAG: isoprenylcysteine carboxylmethyltransferase family protein [Bacteroidota bacterium]